MKPRASMEPTHAVQQPDSTKAKRRSGASAGFLVLGMHRSGTSVLARLLAASGANPGERLVPGSHGNEDGHWEDAFAVETNERLLSALGYRWDDLRPLPAGWLRSEAAVAARAQIRDYLRSSLSKHALWAIKDPRMCLLAELWLQAFADEGCTPSVLLLGRHPQEIARSLAVRDGMASGKAMLLWLRHALDAERASRGLPRAFLGYDELLSDPAGVLHRIERLPGGERLRPAPGGEAGQGIVRQDRRHHRHDDAALPEPIELAWQAQLAAVAGNDDPRAFDRADEALARAESLFAPVLQELEREQALLWDRTARAEAALAKTSHKLADVPETLAQLRDTIDVRQGQVIDAIGDQVGGLVARQQENHAALTGLSQAVTDATARNAEALTGLSQAIGGLQDNSTSALTDLSRAVTDSTARNAQALTGLSQAMSALQDNSTSALTEVSRTVTDSTARNAQALTGLSQAVTDATARNTETLTGLSRAMTESAARNTDTLTDLARLVSDSGSRVTGLAEALAHARAQDAETLSSLGVVVNDAVHRMAETLGSEMRRMQGEALQAHEEIAALRHERNALAGDLAQARNRMHGLQHDSDLLQRVRDSWSWRWTKPFRVVRRLLAGGQDGYEERGRLGRWWALQLAGTRFLPPTLRERMRLRARAGVTVQPQIPLDAAPGDAGLPPIAQAAAADATVAIVPANPDRPDVFIWAVIDWHFRTQRPQHLAAALAGAGHRVFYLSNNLVDSGSPGFRIEPLDGSGRLFQVNLHVAGAPAIYYGAPSEQATADLRRSMGELMQWADSDGGLCILQHPFWLDAASTIPGSALLYDCMDHHAGFENNAAGVIEAEERLIADADLLVVTSDWLDRKLADANPHRALIRNATEYGHFCDPPKRLYRDPQGRRIIGYYGAIAEWFDVELVRAIARRFPDCAVLLVGNDTIDAAKALSGEPNVAFTGEVPYAELPGYLHAFDVALLPFRVIELTLATNPVKVYEYLSAGKPVVAVDLPETAQFGDLIHRAPDHAAFLDAVAAALAGATEAGEADRVEARKAFAREQTWAHRARQLDEAIASMPAPRVSVVVLTYNNLDFTKACLHSIERESNWPDLEVIVVDNASGDGTREYLQEWERGGGNRKVILNDDNLGFAAGNNVGLAAATGEYLILLNNDTYVTPNWVRTLVNHLRRNPGIGIIGPVTNNIGNEARIEIGYADMRGMKSAAAAYTRRHAGHVFPLRTVAFFCVAMPRATYAAVGPLDPAFGVGFFEDDDYCRRVEAAGLGVACADDVFVHHHLSASFDKLKAEKRQELFLRNKAIYEAKWGEWIPHAYRQQAGP